MKSNLDFIPNDMMSYYGNIALDMFHRDINGKINPININTKLSIQNFSFENNAFGVFIIEGIHTGKSCIKELDRCHAVRDKDDVVIISCNKRPARDKLISK